MIAGDAVRVGVVGLGFFGLKHLAVLSNMRGVKVVAVCDRDDARARDVGERYGITGTFSDPVEMTTQAEVDAIHVVTPEDQHVDCVMPALAEGTHVLCEKPLSLDTQEISAMEEAAQRTGAFLMPGHILRFDDRYRLIRDLIDRDELGEVAYLNFRRFGNREIFPEVWASAPGPYVASIHDVDLALWYVGQPPARVTGMATAVIEDSVPDSYAFLVEFTSGAVAVFETSCLPPAGSPFLTASTGVYGTKGSAQVTHPSEALTTNLGSGPQTEDVFSWPESRPTAANSHTAPGGALEREIRYFIECVRSGTAPEVVTAADAGAAVGLVRAAVTATQVGEIVTVASGVRSGSEEDDSSTRRGGMT